MTKTQLDVDTFVPDELIKELLTPSEWRMIKQRYTILKLLEEGQSIRAIASQAKVGTDTVVRTARKLESNLKLKEAMKKTDQSLQTSKWVFGQVGVEEER